MSSFSKIAWTCLFPLFLSASCVHQVSQVASESSDDAPYFEVTAVSGHAADPEMLALMKPYSDEVAKLAEPIVMASEEMSITSPRRERPIVTWVADMMREQAALATAERIDIAMMNAGGVRATLAAGPVSYQTIVTILPFDNTIGIVRLSGDQLWELCEEIARRRFTVGISGMEIHADADANLHRVLVGGEQIDRNRTYTLATIDYIAEGGENYTTFAGLSFEGTGIFLRDAALNHVRDLAANGRNLEPPAQPYRLFFDGQTNEVLND